MDKIRGISLGTAGIGCPILISCNQPGSKHRFKEFIVWDFRFPAEAAKEGMGVVFNLIDKLIDIKDEERHTISVATHITLLSVVRVSSNRLPKCDFCSSRAEIMIKAGYENGGAAEYARTCLADIDRAIGLIATGERRVLKYSDIGLGDKKWRSWEEKLKS